MKTTETIMQRGLALVCDLAKYCELDSSATEAELLAQLERHRQAAADEPEAIDELQLIREAFGVGRELATAPTLANLNRLEQLHRQIRGSKAA